jgi:hypothetical protein
MKAALFVVLVAVVGSLAACWTNEVRQREECVPVDSGAAACRTAADPSLFTELAGDCQSPLVSVDQGPVFVDSGVLDLGQTVPIPLCCYLTTRESRGSCAR